MATTWCSELTLQDLTVLTSLRKTKINRTSIVFHDRAFCCTWTLSNSVGQARLTCLRPRTSHIKTILLDSTAWVGQDFMFERMYPVNLMMKMCQVAIQQCEGYTQHKPEVVDYYEPFRGFLHQILKGYAPKRKFWRNYNYRGLIVKLLLTLGLRAVFIKFCIIYG